MHSKIAELTTLIQSKDSTNSAKPNSNIGMDGGNPDLDGDGEELLTEQAKSQRRRLTELIPQIFDLIPSLEPAERESPSSSAIGGLKISPVMEVDKSTLPLDADTVSLLKHADSLVAGFVSEQPSGTRVVKVVKPPTAGRQWKDIPAVTCSGTYKGVKAMTDKGSFIKNSKDLFYENGSFYPSLYRHAHSDECYVGHNALKVESGIFPESLKLKQGQAVKVPYATIKDWETLNRRSVEVNANCNLFLTSAMTILRKLLKGDLESEGREEGEEEEDQSPPKLDASHAEEIRQAFTFLEALSDSLVTTQCAGVINLTNSILLHRDAYLQQTSPTVGQPLRIAPLFQPALFPQNVVERVALDVEHKASKVQVIVNDSSRKGRGGNNSAARNVADLSQAAVEAGWIASQPRGGRGGGGRGGRGGGGRGGRGARGGGRGARGGRGANNKSGAASQKSKSSD